MGYQKTTCCLAFTWRRPDVFVTPTIVRCVSLGRSGTLPQLFLLCRFTDLLIAKTLFCASLRFTLPQCCPAVLPSSFWSAPRPTCPVAVVSVLFSAFFCSRKMRLCSRTAQYQPLHPGCAAAVIIVLAVVLLRKAVWRISSRHCLPSPANKRPFPSSDGPGRVTPSTQAPRPSCAITLPQCDVARH